jgi:dihydroflavonol-4-reductase
MIGQRQLPSAQRGRGTKPKAGLELVTVNPSLVLGPVLGSDFSASVEAVRKLLDGSIPALPHFGFSLVDVRDIAMLQLLAMTTPSAAGQRFIGSCELYWMADIAKILKQGLGDKARKVPSISVPDFLVRVIAIFDPVARGRLYELGKPRQVSSEKARRMLGWTTRAVSETILDTAKSLQAQGLV